MILTGKKIASTCTTPEVVLDPEGVITIKGRSMNKNTPEFYEPVADWIRSYIDDPADMTRVDVHLEYCNDVSAKTLITLLRKISDIKVKNKSFEINWYYEDDDEDIYALGEKISLVLDIPVKFILI